jgi:DNA-binding CsgD family transcriptional regulator
VFVKDVRGAYLRANDRQAKSGGFAKGTELLGQIDQDFFSAHVATSLQYNDQKVIKEKKAKIFIEHGVYKNGKAFTAISHKKPIWSKKNKIVGIFGFAFLPEECDALDLTFLFNPLGNPASFAKNKNILSPRQEDCLVLLIRGMRSKKIAQELNLSSRTVEHYIEALKIKLSVRSRSELIVKGLELPEIRERM